MQEIRKVKSQTQLHSYLFNYIVIEHCLTFLDFSDFVYAETMLVKVTLEDNAFGGNIFGD